MWSLKFLSGPKAGKEFLLQNGLVILGRDKNCAIPILYQGISKKHAQIFVKEDQLLIEDLNSSNGTFVKGKQIRKEILKDGDRVILSSDLIFEVSKKTSLDPHFPLQAFPQSPNPYVETASAQTASPVNEKNSLLENILKSIKYYVNETLLPGIYHLARWIEFKVLIACFVVGFIVMTTVLSVFPLISILKSSIEQESFNTAETIAQTLSESNTRALRKNLLSSLNVDYALKRSGVEKAFIISAIDGRVLAPSEIAHTYPKESYIHKARKRDVKTVEKVDGSSVAAIVPISVYNYETGQSSPKAYAVVVYQMESLAAGTKKVLSLVVQTFLIAFILGIILFFFLINLVEFPLRSINRQLEKALKEDQAPSIFVDYQSQLLLDLCSHINSALNQISLNKMVQSQNKELDSTPVDRQNERSNLVEVVGFPCLAVNLEDKTISAVNSNFTEQLGYSDILYQAIEDISDSELKAHLSQLIEQGELNPQEISFGEIFLKEMKLQSTCQFIMGNNSPSYAIITFMTAESEEGAA